MGRMLEKTNTPLSVLLVLSLGGFIGGVVKGVTGFGNAILNLLVWVAFTAVGVNAGPLQLAVLADSFACVVCSIPLLVLTSAHKTADWRLVIAILFFSSAGAPLGAELLTHLDVRWVEFSMSGVLVMVICLHVKLREKLRDTLRKWNKSRRLVNAGHSALNSDGNHEAEGVAVACPAAEIPCQDPSLLAVPALSLAAVRSGSGPCYFIGSNQDHSTTPFAECTFAECSQQPGLGQKTENANGGAEAFVSLAVSPSETERLLDPGLLASDAALSQQSSVHCPSCAGNSSSKWTSFCCCTATCDSIGTRLRRWHQKHDWKEVQRVLLFGSTAGFASGVMGGMTGIGGPPLMFVYEKLKVAKEVVRGTNAFNNVFQIRLVSYFVMGVCKREDMLIYAVTSAMGLTGVILGNSLAGRLDQKGFSRVLIALMIICCLLLLASAAGLKGHAT